MDVVKKRIKIKSNSVVLRNDSWKNGDTYHWGKQEIRNRFWFLEESGCPGLDMLLVRTWITQWDMFSWHVRREDCSSNRRRGLTYRDLRVLRFYIILKALTWQNESCSIVSDSLWHHGLYSPWNSPGQNTVVGSFCLLQGIFPTQGSNPRLPHCRQILYQLSHKGRPIQEIEANRTSWNDWYSKDEEAKI